MAEQGLKDKTVKGIFWSAIEAFLGQGVTFIVGIILARLLTPAEYGLIGIVTIFTSIMLNIVDSGFSNSLIRKEHVSEQDYNTLFYFNLFVSVLMFVVLFLCAPTISDFFNLPQLVPLCRVTGLLLIFQALSITHYTILSREIDFKTKTKASVISSIVSGAVGIGMAYSGFGVWSLVAQLLSKQLFFSICLWMFKRWRPHPVFSLESLYYMWNFGWKLMLSGLLYSIWNQLYQAVVGRFYNPATLGQYSRSKEYANMFSGNLAVIVQRVSFPVLAKIQNDNERMVSAYRRVIKISMFVTSISLTIMGAISEPLIYCLIGPQWHEAASYLPLICLSLSFYPLNVLNLNMLQIQNRTDIFLYLEIIKKIIAILPICLGIFVSIYWMLIGTIITGVLSTILNGYYSGKSLDYSAWMQIKDVMPNYFIAFIIAFVVYFLKYIPASYWLILPLQIATSVIMLIVICELKHVEEYVEIRNIIKKYTSKLTDH